VEFSVERAGAVLAAFGVLPSSAVLRSRPQAIDAEAWERRLVAAGLPRIPFVDRQRLSRSQLFALGREAVAGGEAEALRFYVHVCAWGSGTSDLLAARTFKPLAEPGAMHKLSTVLKLLQHVGPVEAYRLLNNRSELKIVGLGPAFFTKLLHFASPEPGPNDEAVGALILDARVARSFGHRGDPGLKTAGWRTDEYQGYLEAVQSLRGGPWAVVPADVIEYALFMAEGRLGEFRRVELEEMSDPEEPSTMFLAASAASDHPSPKAGRGPGGFLTALLLILLVLGVGLVVSPGKGAPVASPVALASDASAPTRPPTPRPTPATTWTSSAAPTTPTISQPTGWALKVGKRLGKDVDAASWNAVAYKNCSVAKSRNPNESTNWWVPVAPDDPDQPSQQDLAFIVMASVLDVCPGSLRATAANWPDMQTQLIVAGVSAEQWLQTAAPSISPLPTHPVAPLYGNGYAVTCGDGTTSHAGGRQGACSHHGGVR